MFTVPQLVMLVAVGAMKSFRAAVKESEDRLFRYALPNEVQVPPPPPSASKSSWASPNVRAETLPRPSDSPDGIADVLIDPVASPAALRLTLVPQQGTELDA
jgi:hypothetical protein